ncbi:MAG TPA: type II toxin-antitoxin system RelE/ParE family toxin [bacterium]|nr:type II toxin-antitoxin system RelE/ParE family toxin [bacterium]
MTEYHIEFRPAAYKKFIHLPSNIQRYIDKHLLEIRTHPRPAGIKKLKGSTNRWSLRVGDYRVIYEIYDNELLILVLTIDNRKDAYRK